MSDFGSNFEIAQVNIQSVTSLLSVTSTMYCPYSPLICLISFSHRPVVREDEQNYGASGFTRWLMGLGRDRVKQVIALITGHGHFRKHLNTLGLRNEDSECRLCNKSEETAKHIILDCERLGARRRALFGDKQPGDEPDASIGEKLLSLIKGTKIGLPL
ncbi:hypothetical protein J6590_046197 [Homalodisca vitripennis]|nr:hypothetical protein J6590_046197 [Homalodisca vitripennis]